MRNTDTRGRWLSNRFVCNLIPLSASIWAYATLKPARETKEHTMKLKRLAMITALLGSVLIISPASRAADDEKKDEKPAAPPATGARAGGARGDRLAQMAKELDLTDAQ